MKRLAALLGLVIFTVAASTASATTSGHAGSAPLSSQVALDWNSYAVDAVRAAHTLDGVPAGGAPRTLYQPEGLIYMAYVEAAVYDAVTKIDHRYRPYHHFEAAAGDASSDAAVASAAYATLVHYLGDPSGTLAAHYAASIGALPNDKTTARGIAVGQAAAADIEQLRAGDGLDAPTAVFGAPFIYDATNAGQWQVVPPPVAPQIVVLIVCVPRAFASTSARAAVTQPCAAGYSGWLGVESSGAHVGSAVVWVAVEVGVSDRRVRPPRQSVVLGVEAGDSGISGGQ